MPAAKPQTTTMGIINFNVAPQVKSSTSTKAWNNPQTSMNAVAQHPKPNSHYQRSGGNSTTSSIDSNTSDRTTVSQLVTDVSNMSEKMKTIYEFCQNLSVRQAKLESVGPENTNNAVMAENARLREELDEMKEIVKNMNDGLQQFLQQQRQILQNTHIVHPPLAINEITIVTNNNNDVNEIPITENEPTVTDCLPATLPQITIPQTDNVILITAATRPPSPTIHNPPPELLLQINQFNGTPVKRNVRLNLPTPPTQDTENSQLPPAEDRKPPAITTNLSHHESTLVTNSITTSLPDLLPNNTKRRSKSKLTHHATILASITGSDIEDEDIIDDTVSNTTSFTTSPRKRPDVKSTPTTTTTESTSCSTTPYDIESGEQPRTLFHDMLDTDSSAFSDETEIQLCPDTSVESADSGLLG